MSLPAKWASAHISDLFSKIVDGSHNPPAGVSDGVPMLSARNIYNDQIEFGEFRRIPKKAFEVEDARTRIRAGDVLLTIVGTIGRSAIVTEATGPIVLQRSVAVLTPRFGNPRYWMYQFQAPHIQHVLAQKARGTAQKGVYLRTLGALELRVAPTVEQDRIVAEIEKQFTRLDDAVAALKRVQANLKRYRASVLKAACEGSLVPTEAELARKEGRDYEPASELLKRILAERRAQWEANQLHKMIATGKPPKDDGWKKKYKEAQPPSIANLPKLAEGWEWASLDQLTVDALIGLDRGREHQHSKPVGTPYVKMNNVSMEGQVAFDDLVYIDATEEEGAKFSIFDGDLLFNTRNSVELVGKVGIVTSPPSKAVFNNNLMRIRLSSAINPKFVCAQMTAEIFRKQMELVKRATTNVAAVYAKDLFPLAIALPPASEQYRISEATERQVSTVRQLVKDYDNLQDRNTALRHSILRQAFSGKLVPQDPNDEPASVLLERIRAERARAQELNGKASKATNGGSSVDGQRRRRVAKLAQRVSAGKR